MYVPKWVHVLSVEKCNVNLYRPKVFKGNIVGLIVERNREGNALFKQWSVTVGTTVDCFLTSGTVCGVQLCILRKMLCNGYWSDYGQFF
jgi:hypothetical protein